MRQHRIMNLVENLKNEINKEKDIIEEHQIVIDEKEKLIKSYILNE